MIQLVRFSVQNPNWEKALEGKFGKLGEDWGSITVVKNILYVVAYKGAKVTDYVLPEVYDGFLMCSDGTVVPVNDSKFTLDLPEAVSAMGILQLRKDN
jgi:hypothetical protein